MTLQLSQKERMLLEDQKSHEEVCIQKYNNYSNQATDPELKQLFKTYAGEEQEHLNSVNQMLSGQIPNMSAKQNSSPNTNTNTNAQFQSSAPGSANPQHDAALCTDMLMTEKFVSGGYDTAVFEFRDTNARNTLNHIQKEEQGHGEGIYKYMEKNNMYTSQ